jgi:hypothetical protein
MQAVKTNPTPIPRMKTRRWVFIALLALLLIAAAFGLNGRFSAIQAGRLPPGTVVISQTALEEQYGLRVNLLAVTAAGGLVDLRLKIVDGEKFKRLLADAKTFPVLRTSQGVLINAPAETKSQKIEYVSGGGLYVMYPNALNAIKQNTAVTILFGNIALEPILTK